MKCAIHQPQFLPWLGYLHKIHNVAKFVFLDNVQFKKNEFQNRNRLLISGAARWLTVPVSFKFGATLRETRIAATVPWRKKMMHTLELNYAPAPYFRQFAESLAQVINQEWQSIAELNMATVRWLMGCFEIQTETFTSSQFAAAENAAGPRLGRGKQAVYPAESGVPPYQETEGIIQSPTMRIIEICRRVGADTYLSGVGGLKYLEAAEFEQAGIKLEFQDFQHPVYAQHHSSQLTVHGSQFTVHGSQFTVHGSQFTVHGSQFREEGAGFVANLSALDGLFNCGGGAAGRKRLNIDVE